MKIICIARNYLLHIEEMDKGGRPSGDPVFFIKPDTALLRNNDPFYLPSFSDELDYETEMVVKINRTAKAIEERFAGRCYDEVGLGIDFTARDIQRRCIAEGLPWEMCKSFDRSAAVSPRFLKLVDIGGNADKLCFEMELNGEKRQAGDTSRMIFAVDRLISHVSQFITLRIGDLIFTGTPAGVGSLKKGDRIVARLAGKELINMEIR